MSNIVKYLGGDPDDEFEYYIEINEQKVIVFNDFGVPYPVKLGSHYPVEFYFFYVDNPVTEINNESRYGFEKIENDYYGYYVYGKYLDDGKLDMGNGFILDKEEHGEENSYLQNHFIKIKVDRIDMRFLSYDEFNSDSKPEPYKFGSLEL